MSLQGPLVVITEHPSAALLESLSADGAFPVVAALKEEVAEALEAAQPSAILLAEPDIAADPRVAHLLSQYTASAAPIVPILACVMPEQDIACRDALPLSHDAPAGVISVRLASALRVRQLHDAVLRCAQFARDQGLACPEMPAGDPLQDACIIVAGRGRDYPALATMIGEQANVIGALSIEIAARYLKSRTADGLIIADGFNAWSVGALLTVLTEDDRFRDLPIGLLGRPTVQNDVGMLHAVHARDPHSLARRLLPLARLHAFEARLRRLMEAFDKNGTLDPATGLQTADAFLHALNRALADAQERSTGLSLARFTFEGDARMRTDAARLLGRLIRGADFAHQDEDGAALVAFADTDLKHAHVVARRIAAVLKHTAMTPGTEPLAPAVTLVSRKAGDSIETLLARLMPPAVAAE
jgi:hypothetical protein